MHCPKCGYKRQPKDNAFVPPTECPACGVVYAKYESERLAGRIPKILRRPSPVDESTLKQARERVEQRLRKKMLNRSKNEEKAHTVELARKLFLEELRQRMEKVSLKASSNENGQDQTVFMEQQPEDTIQTEAEQVKDLPTAMAKTPKNPTSPDTENKSSGLPEPSTGTEDSTKKEKILSPVERNLTENYEKTAADKPNGPRWLPVAGIISLVAGIVGALVSWIALPAVQAQTIVHPAESSQGLPIELVVGFCYLAIGILGGALFWTIFLMTRQLNQMRRILATFISQRHADEITENS